MSVQFNHDSYRAEIDIVKYAKALIEHNLEGVNLALLEQREEITIIRHPKKEETMPKKKVETKKEEKNEKTLKELIEELREHMHQENIVRLEITKKEVKADVVQTVNLVL